MARRSRDEEAGRDGGAAEGAELVGARENSGEALSGARHRARRDAEISGREGAPQLTGRVHALGDAVERRDTSNGRAQVPPLKLQRQLVAVEIEAGVVGADAAPRGPEVVERLAGALALQ